VADYLADNSKRDASNHDTHAQKLGTSDFPFAIPPQLFRGKTMGGAKSQ
jgi:hypothetical protein